jgi:hypothetical protein
LHARVVEEPPARVERNPGTNKLRLELIPGPLRGRNLRCHKKNYTKLGMFHNIRLAKVETLLRAYGKRRTGLS